MPSLHSFWNLSCCSPRYQQVGNWTAAKLPLDVWALDMNWRHIGVNDSKASVGYCKSQSNDDPGCRDHFYRYVFQCSKYI